MAKRQKRAKKAVKEKQPVLSKPMQEAMIRFLEYHPAKRFSKNVRKMLLEYLMSDGAVENLYFNDLLYDLEGLFDLLDVAEEEWGNSLVNDFFLDG